MVLDDKKKAFITLGKFMSQFTSNPFVSNAQVPNNASFFDPFAALIHSSVHHNGWFTTEQVMYAIKSWADVLTEENLDTWTSRYRLETEPLKRVGMILAGNIPLVGFHDLLSVLLSGNIAVVKLSSNDQKLLPFLVNYLISIEPAFEDRVVFTEEKLEDFDAVIATGSNNTARYFEFYFSKYPNIIRKNRNSVAVLNGKETEEELIALGRDIFTYFGLGCRNVSKIYVPKDYNFDAFFKAMFHYKELIEYEKYSNNYDYNKAVFLMSEFKILDNGFMTIKEDIGYASPISSVFYEYYEDLEVLNNQLQQEQEKLQCVVSNDLVTSSIAFGTTQEPQLWDYADGVDTMAFLLKL